MRVSYCCAPKRCARADRGPHRKVVPWRDQECQRGSAFSSHLSKIELLYEFATGYRPFSSEGIFPFSVSRRGATLPLTVQAGEV